MSADDRLDWIGLVIGPSGFDGGKLCHGPFYLLQGLGQRAGDVDPAGLPAVSACLAASFR